MPCDHDVSFNFINGTALSGITFRMNVQSNTGTADGNMPSAPSKDALPEPTATTAIRNFIISIITSIIAALIATVLVCLPSFNLRERHRRYRRNRQNPSSAVSIPQSDFLSKPLPSLITHHSLYLIELSRSLPLLPLLRKTRSIEMDGDLPFHNTTMPTPDICGCGSLTNDATHSGPSNLWLSRPEEGRRRSSCSSPPPTRSRKLPEPWESFEDNDPWFPATREAEHRMMLVTLAEHVLSRAKFLEFVGGSAEDRVSVIKTITEPHRALLLKLVGDTMAPSPLRNNEESMAQNPSYAAADMARALFHHKHLFTSVEWYIICADWFRSWTGLSMAEALVSGVGDEEWEVKWGMEVARLGESGDVEALAGMQPRLKRRFRAFAYWEEGFPKSCKSPNPSTPMYHKRPRSPKKRSKEEGATAKQ
ncbi:hypothetical protein TWF730_008268 [Orbilia blumenaviensis]|uniref:Uncharacterized protein n=1 Tax=Orbilia blumenaviensis TaxID=1796055 RepID=A0AAV9V447_9PEZI